MKILLACPTPPAANGAGALPRVLYSLVTGLVERHDVTIVTVSGPDHDTQDAVFDLRREGFDVRTSTRRDGFGGRSLRRRVRTSAALGVHRWPRRVGTLYDPRFVDHVRSRFAQGPVDVFHAEDDAVAVYDFGDAASVLTEHQVKGDPPAPAQAGPGPSRLAHDDDWRRWRRYQPQAWQRFDRVQVFSDRDRGAATALAPALADRFDVNPFGITLPTVCDPAKEQDGEILYIADFSQPTNVDAAQWLAREILPVVVQHRPSAHLTLIGANAPHDVRRLAGERVTFLGRVDDPRRWFEQAAVVAAPVRVGGGMKMKVLESLALGKAVVTTSFGVEGLTGAPLVYGDDLATSVRKITELLADDDRRRDLGRRARRHVEQHFSPQAHVLRLEGTYERALEAYARRRASGG